MVVMTEAELKADVVNDATIFIGADIYLTSAVKVDSVIGLTIEGNGFRVDGQQKGGCFYITSSDVIFKNITVTNGISVINFTF